MGRKENRLAQRMAKKPNHKLQQLQNSQKILRLLSEVQPMKEADFIVDFIQIHEAFKKLQDGLGTPDDFNKVVCNINIGLNASRMYAPDLENHLAQGARAMDSCRVRYLSKATFGFTQMEKEAVAYTLEVLEELVRNSTKRQIYMAWQESMKGIDRQITERVKQGKSPLPSLENP